MLQGLGALLLLGLAALPWHIAHGAELNWRELQPKGGYDHEGGAGWTLGPWMSLIRDDTLLADLSLPGSHDTCSYNYPKGMVVSDFIRTQSLNLTQQLNAGIRALDIRTRHVEDRFLIHHDLVYLYMNFDEVMREVSAFLSSQPTETLVMRIKQDAPPGVNTRTLDSTLNDYIQTYRQWLWFPNNSQANPTLGDVRGKLVILQDMATPRSDLMQYRTLVAQDDWNCPSQSWLYSKWERVKQHYATAAYNYQPPSPSQTPSTSQSPVSGQAPSSQPPSTSQSPTTSSSQTGQTAADSNRWYLNYLSANGLLCPPWFIASGKVAPPTNASAAWTGETSCTACTEPYPDFPRADCGPSDTCKVTYSGTNLLATDYLSTLRGPHIGITMADFPGTQLIAAIIQQNAPAAAAGVRISADTAGLCVAAAPPRAPPPAAAVPAAGPRDIATIGAGVWRALLNALLTAIGVPVNSLGTLTLTPCEKRLSQQTFQLTRASVDGYYSIVHTGSGQCWHAAQYGYGPRTFLSISGGVPWGAALVLAPCDGSPAQQFGLAKSEVVGSSPGGYVLTVRQTQLCVSVAGVGGAGGGESGVAPTLRQAACRATSPQQLFSVIIQ